MMPHEENHTLEVHGGSGDLTGAKLFVTRPCCNIDIGFSVEECLSDDGNIRTYKMVPLKE